MADKKTISRNILISVSMIFFLIALDQYVKILAYQFLRGTPVHVYLSGMIQVEYAENRGAFLSLGAGLSEDARFWIFVCGVFFVLAFCIYSLWRSVEHLYSVIALSLVIAGGIGNLIDRVLRGSVIDYIHMGIGGLRTGVFNIADVAISTGVIMMMVQQLISKKDSDT